MRAKLREIKETLRKHRHKPIDEQGRWLGTVMRGYFAYFAVPTNSATLNAFRWHVIVRWLREPEATEPTASDDMATDVQLRRPAPAICARLAPMAGATLPRRLLKVRAQRANRAR